MIQCTGIEKSYTDKKVLSGISFDIPDGQIFGLLGPSGAGKTTLIKILTGQLEFDEGTAMILQKKGAPFMMASVVIWTLVTITRMLPVDIMTKNLYTFYCPGMLLPCVLIFSKIIGAHVFKNRSNPFNKLGFINTANQMLYLLIVMWAFNQKPDAMLMLFAMVFGAHLLPFSWLYDSKTYLVMSLVTTFGSMLISIFAGEVFVGIFMILCQIIMSVLLLLECRKLDRDIKSKNDL